MAFMVVTLCIAMPKICVAWCKFRRRTGEAPNQTGERPVAPTVATL